MSQWISSETTTTPRRSQIAASRRSVSSGQTMPAGLCGLERSSSRAVVVQKGFELLEVHFVAVARAPQRVADHAASHLFGDQPEGVVDGRLDDHLVARTGKCQHCHADTLDDAGNEAHPRRDRDASRGGLRSTRRSAASSRRAVAYSPARDGRAAAGVRRG